MTTMTPASQHVSEHILAPLRRIARRHWLLVALRCVLQLVTIGLLVLLAIALILGHLPNLSPFLRLPMVFLTWSGIVTLGYFAIRPMFQSWSVDRAALAVEHSLPQVQERISSAVELSNDKELRYRASESLIAHLISQAEEDASNIQPEMVIRPRGLLVWALALAPVLGIWAIAAFAKPLTMEAGLFRVFMPWKSELPAFLARISVTPMNTIINQGEPLTITLKISPEAGSPSNAPGQAMLVKRFTSGQVLSQDLDRSDTLQFAATLQNVQQGFSYRVDSAAGQSPWYTVTVRARPAISGIDLSYEYPTYTQIAPKTISAPDGAIEAVVGTKVRLTVHATQPLNERSQLTMDPGMPDAAELPLTLAAPGTTDYQATLLVHDNGTYHFVLVNTDGLEGIADETRTITAHSDQPPTIAIVSPHTPSMSVRNDDTVPIRYKAGDDFGVQKIQALISVDDREVGPFNLIFDPADRRNINGQYNLSVAYMLQQANVQGAHRITYQFEAWDNRDPNPQTALSVKQSLLISQQPIQSYEARLAAKDANHLTEAINVAIDRLNHADEHVNQLQQADVTRPLRAGERETAERCKNLLTKTATDLTAAADDAFSSEMADVAAKAGDIAAHPITDAAQSVAKAQLDADAGTQRQQDVTTSGQRIADARTQLQALLSQVKNTEQRSEAARDLAQAAKDQEKVAQDMAKLAKEEQTAKNDQNPQNPQNAQNPQSQQNQQNQQAQQNEQKDEQQLQKDEQKADQDVQQAMNEDPSVKQDSEAQKTADKLASLQKKIDDLHDQQEAQSQATAQQKAPDLSKIAAEQKVLNDQIKQFEQQQQNNLQQAKTTPPPDPQQNQIVSDLNNGQPSPAASNMQKAVDQLNNNAQQMQQASATTQPFTQAQQNKLDQDSQAQDTAKNDQSQAEQAATALNQQTQPPGANDPTVQQAQQAAQAIQQQAKSMTPQANAAADAQTSAEQEAQKATADAQAAASAQTPADATKDMQQAAQELRHAANDLVQAEQQNAAADKSAMAAQQAQAEQQAAAQAQALAQQQQDILTQTQPNAQAAKDEAVQQQQIAQANQDAQQLQQMAQTDQDDDVTQRATDAQQALQQATDQAQQATQAEQNNHPDQAAQHEANSAHQLALADNALRGQPPQQPQEAQNDQDPADPHQTMDDQQNQQGQPDPNSQQANAQQPDQQGQQQGPPDMTQQPGQQQGQQQQGQQQQGQQQGQQQQGQQQGQQQQGQSQQGQQPGQQQANAQSQDQQSQQQQGQQQGQGQSGKSHQGQAQSANSEQAHEQADEAADEAANAQSQAQGQGQSGKGQQEAQQAANELAKAAQDMQQSAEDSKDSKDSPDSFASNSGHGKASMAQKSTKPEPAAVQAMGVSSRDWAKLPPLMQQDLLNAAQQNSLPAYRESIKNYFEKIARLKEPGQSQQSSND
jgi:hypothetical protein